MNKNKAYVNLSIFDFMDMPVDTIVRFSSSDYRNYIIEHFDIGCDNDLFFKLLLSSQYSSSDSIKWIDSLEDEFQSFNNLYNTLTIHLDNEYIQIFSIRFDYLNGPCEYSIFLNVKESPYIIQLPRIISLTDSTICAPACAIWWYNKNGTMAYDYLTYKNDFDKSSFLNLDIRFPKDSKQFSFYGYYNDYREYFFFKYLKLHKWAHNNRVSILNFDSFTNYYWSFPEMISYFTL